MVRPRRLGALSARTYVVSTDRCPLTQVRTRRLAGKSSRGSSAAIARMWTSTVRMLMGRPPGRLNTVAMWRLGIPLPTSSATSRCRGVRSDKIMGGTACRRATRRSQFECGTLRRQGSPFGATDVSPATSLVRTAVQSSAASPLETLCSSETSSPIPQRDAVP